jgi:hypothetical protein
MTAGMMNQVSASPTSSHSPKHSPRDVQREFELAQRHGTCRNIGASPRHFCSEDLFG